MSWKSRTVRGVGWNKKQLNRTKKSSFVNGLRAEIQAEL